MYGFKCLATGYPFPTSILSLVLSSFSIPRKLVSLSFPCSPSPSFLISVCCLEFFFAKVCFMFSSLSHSCCVVLGLSALMQMATNKKIKLPPFSPLSSRLELIPRPHSSERGSFVVACCQSSSYFTPTISLATLMTKTVI